jgi:myo-inositol 2-dehydrogenase / D-chiro-inositol 1-dehydrogenase
MPDSNQTRYGLIGCGMMGQEHLRNIALLSGVEVAAIFEPDPEMREISQRLAPKARMVAGPAEVFATPSLDAVLITSPNHCHAAQIAMTLEQSAVPVLVEKPACVSIAEARALEALAGRATAPVWVGMEYRYMPPIAAMIERVHGQPVSGAPVMLTVREHRYPFLPKVGDWNRFSQNTGGTLVEKCCHFFDLMRLIMKANPVRLFASGSMNHNHSGETYAGRAPDILDNAYVVLDFPDRRRAMLELCMFAEASEYQEEIIAVSPLGKITCRVPGPSRFWPQAIMGPQPTAELVIEHRDPRRREHQDIAVDSVLLQAGDHNGSTFYQHEKFLAVVRGTGTVEVTLADGINAALIGLAAEHSAATGTTVDLTAGPYRLLAAADPVRSS